MARILPITPEIDLACEELDRAVGLFLDARSTLPSLGRYESEIEALNLFYLTLRDVEGVVALARSDLVLLPAAMAVARVGLEIAVKAAWIVGVEDRFQREVRWLAHLRAEERFCQRVEQRLADLGKDVEGIRSRAEAIRSFRLAVAQALPPGVQELPGNPTFEEMLKSVGENDSTPCTSICRSSCTASTPRRGSTGPGRFRLRRRGE